MTRSERARRTVLIGMVFLLVLCPVPTYSDDAVVLPKGLWRIFNDTQFGLPYDKRYNKDGDNEPLAIDLNAELNSFVFTGLQALEIPNPAALGCNLVPAPAYCLQPGTASLGRSVVSFERSFVQSDSQIAYGVTDRLSVGAMIPYIWQRNTVQASLDSSTATVGTNAAAVSPTNPFGLVPIGAPLPGTQAPTTELAQQLLMSQGFKRLESWSDQGVGDIEVGGKYQYYRSDNWRVAFTGGARFPTGKVDDPDDLADSGFGPGAYALLFRFHQDFVMQPEGLEKRMGPPGPGAFYINTTFRYDLYLPDTQNLRVCSVHEPLCLVEEDVDRNIGDTVQAELSGSLGIFMNGLYITPLYRYGHKFKDHYSGNKGLDYGALSTETDFNEHIYRLTLSYTTIPLVIEKKFAFPFLAAVYYGERFAANNNRPHVRAVGLNIAIYF